MEIFTHPAVQAIFQRNSCSSASASRRRVGIHSIDQIQYSTIWKTSGWVVYFILKELGIKDLQ